MVIRPGRRGGRGRVGASVVVALAGIGSDRGEVVRIIHAG